ncbi:MAG: cytochrome c [Azospirillaceae bacterium]
MRIGHAVATALLAAGLAAAAGAAGAQEAGDADDAVDHGRELAQEYCVACHDISADGAFKTYPPSFASIAVFRSDDQIRGRIIFPPSHSTMPQIGYLLEPESVRDLVAFIRSLEQPVE